MSNAAYVIVLIVMSVVIVALLLGMVYLIARASSATRESTSDAARDRDRRH